LPEKLLNFDIKSSDEESDYNAYEIDNADYVDEYYDEEYDEEGENEFEDMDDEISDEEDEDQMAFDEEQPKVEVIPIVKQSQKKKKGQQ